MIEKTLEKLGITLPPTSPPAANYVPFVKTGSLVFISGQLPSWEGVLKFSGKVGQDYTKEQGYEAARLCGVNILSQLKLACKGEWAQVSQCLRLGGFVNSIDDFREHPFVVNGASDLMVDVFGEKGRHARAAVGVNDLPCGAPVEVEALFELK